MVEGGTTSPCSSQVASSLFCAASLCRGTTVYQGLGERAPNNFGLHNDTLKPLRVFIVSRDEGSRAHDWPAEESQYAATILSLPGSHPTGSAQLLYSLTLPCVVACESPDWHWTILSMLSVTQTGPSHSVPKHSPCQALCPTSEATSLWIHLLGFCSTNTPPPKALALLEPLDVSVYFIPVPGHTHEAAAP